MYEHDKTGQWHDELGDYWRPASYPLKVDASFSRWGRVYDPAVDWEALAGRVVDVVLLHQQGITTVSGANERLARSGYRLIDQGTFTRSQTVTRTESNPLLARAQGSTYTSAASIKYIRLTYFRPHVNNAAEDVYIRARNRLQPPTAPTGTGCMANFVALVALALLLRPHRRQPSR